MFLNIPKDVIFYVILPKLDHAFDFMAFRSTCKYFQRVTKGYDEGKLNYGIMYKRSKDLKSFVKAVRNIEIYSPFWLVEPLIKDSVDYFLNLKLPDHKRIYEKYSELNYNYENVRSYKIFHMPYAYEQKVVIYTIVKKGSTDCSMPLSFEKFVKPLLLPKIKLKWRE